MTDTIKRTTGTKVAFGDVVQLSKERSKDPEADGFDRYIGLEHLEPSDLKVRSWGDLADGVTFTNVFRPGQVLFGKRRAYQRKVAVADFSGVCSGDIYVLEPKNDQLLPELLPFICQSEPFYDYVISMSQGGLSPRVNWKALAKYEFALPPLEEQRRIVEVLLQAATLPHKLTQLMESICRVHASKAMAEFAKLLSSVPMVHLGEICVRKPQNGVYKPSQDYGRGIRIVKMNELFAQDVIGDADEMEKVDVDASETERYSLTGDDLLFGRTSIVKEGAGKCVLVASSPGPFVFESNVLRVTIDRDKAYNGYIFEWLRSPHGRQQIQRIVNFTTVYSVTGSDVARLPLPLPPLEVQKQIADSLAGFRKQIVVPFERIERAGELSNTILSQAMGWGL